MITDRVMNTGQLVVNWLFARNTSNTSVVLERELSNTHSKH